VTGPALGLVEWFRPGEHERVEWALERMRALGVARLRTHLSWADWHASGGAEWYDWLFPRLAEQVELLPCAHYTPPSLSETGRANGPPRDLKAFADFIDLAVDRYGACFEALELWNEPNNVLDWDWRVDPEWRKFSEMVGMAAYWTRRRGKTAVLGGPNPNDMDWLWLIAQRGVFEHVDAVALHGFPGIWDTEAGGWTDWPTLIEHVRGVVGPKPALWIAETGYATWRGDTHAQMRSFEEALSAPVERLYWYGLQDICESVPTQEGRRVDQRHYHFGLYDAKRAPKPLARLLARGGAERVRRTLEAAAPALRRARPVLVTGGAGFIGSNLADRLMAEGEDVLVLDALARDGVEENLDWLRARGGRRLSVSLADLRDRDGTAEAVREARAVFHLAAQVAVTTSMTDPVEDFEVNARGTLTVLEAARARGEPVPVILASTNKVYGNLADVALEPSEEGWRPADERLRAAGVGPDRPLAPHTPYGCSKAAADQYVLDYAASFGLPTAVLRMSCVYGRRQFGTEDQGWLAHFALRAMAGEPITLFGDGRQVRDLLHVDDAVAAYLALWRRLPKLSGRAFNLGGGPANAVCLNRALEAIERRAGRRAEVRRDDWRPGDQRWYVSDIRATRAALDLPEPLDWRVGLDRLMDWLGELRPEADAPRPRLMAGGA
jgi:CDP-paratose 2-epimerase